MDAADSDALPSGGSGVRLHKSNGPHDEGQRPEDLDASNDDWRSASESALRLKAAGPNVVG